MSECQSPKDTLSALIPACSPYTKAPPRPRITDRSPCFSPTRQSSSRISSSVTAKALFASPEAKKVCKRPDPGPLSPQRRFFDSISLPSIPRPETPVSSSSQDSKSDATSPSDTVKLGKKRRLLLSCPSFSSFDTSSTSISNDLLQFTTVESLDFHCIFHDNSLFQIRELEGTVTIQATSFESVLQSVWNHDSFKPEQKETLERILNRQSSMLFLPTGHGKTLPLQFFALCSRLTGPVIVVSPLLALINDQVKSLPSCLLGLGAHNYKGVSGSEAFVKRLALSDVIWISPEKAVLPSFREALIKATALRRLLIKELWSNLSKFIEQNYPQEFHRFSSFPDVSTLSQPASLLVIDEVHCFGTWGNNFRSDFLKIPDFWNFLGNPTVLALSATCSFQTRSILQSKFSISSDAISMADRKSNQILSVSCDNQQESALLRLLTSKRLQGESDCLCATS
ncbi:hypothetical protein GEMRC1_007196 [Eukaryota sp. GEM-RC1]